MANDAPVFEYRGPTDIERVITDENGRVFNATFEVDLRGQGEATTAASILRVFDDSGKPIGFANATIQRDSLLVEVRLDYSTPERLDIQSGRRVFIRPLSVSSVDGGVTRNHIIDLKLSFYEAQS